MLPILDLQKAKDSFQRPEVAKQLVRDVEKIGFVYIDSVPEVDFQTLFENVKNFFSLPPLDKHAIAKKHWNQLNSNIYRGYFPLVQGRSYKEGFEIGPEECTDPNVHPMFREPNYWPQFRPGGSAFRDDMQQYYRAMNNVGIEILRLLSLGIGIDENWFDFMFIPESLSTLRLLHYPGILPGNSKSGDTVCPEHTDSGFVTLLNTFHFRGLQILTDTNQWMDVVPRPNSLVMNIGDVLAKLSNGRFKATRHRVLGNLDARFSVPFFFEPKYGAEIDRLLPVDKNIGEETEAGDTTEVKSSTTYGSWLIEKMRQFVEYEDIVIP